MTSLLMRVSCTAAMVFVFLLAGTATVRHYRKRLYYRWHDAYEAYPWLYPVLCWLDDHHVLSAPAAIAGIVMTGGLTWSILRWMWTA